MCLHTEPSGVPPSLLPACRVPVVHGTTLGSGLTEKVALSFCVKRTHTCMHTQTHTLTHTVSKGLVNASSASENEKSLVCSSSD